MRRHHSLLVLGQLIALASAGCHTPVPSDIPRDEPYVIAVKAVHLPESYPWISRFARHYWLDFKDGPNGGWTRAEHDSHRVDSIDISDQTAFADQRWSNDVALEGLVTGEAAQAAIVELRANIAAYESADVYVAFPGPNSNTFVSRMLRRTRGLGAVMHHNAVGKDYAQVANVGLTESGLGLQMETMPIGLEVGLLEGIELHIAQLTFGIRLWRPGIELPFLNRLGF